MKKFFLTLLFILIIPSIFAVEFDVNENYSQGETIIAKLSGNFVNAITSENVFFYRGHVQIPMEFDVSKLDGNYYIYALTSGKSPDNYLISIENVQYKSGNEILEENIVRNFSITNQTADFSVDPGFVSVSGNFYLEIQNLQDNEITVDVNTEPDNSTGRVLISPDYSITDSFSLNSGETKKISFKIKEGESLMQKIELKTENLTYEIPVYIYPSFAESQTKSFGIDPAILTLSFQTNKTGKTAIYLYNSEEEELNDISISLSDSLASSLTLSKSSVESLAANSGVQIELSFFSNAEKKVEGAIQVTSGNKTISSVVSVNFLNNYTASNETQTVTKRTCAEMNGTICASDEECSIEVIYASDNVCCKGKCESSNSSSTGTIVAIIILVIIIVGIVFFYLKYKKAKKPVNLLEIAKGKSSVTQK